MILLNELKIKDFISHSDTNLIFKDNQKLLISGISGQGNRVFAKLFCFVYMVMVVQTIVILSVKAVNKQLFL